MKSSDFAPTKPRRSIALAVTVGVALTAAACNSSTSSNSSATTASAGSTVTTGATGASAGWQTTVSEANKEGSLTWYTTNLPDESTALVTAFNKKYPAIHVAVARVLTGLGPKLLAEKQTGAAGADVATTNDPTVAPSLAATNGLVQLNGPSAGAWKGNKYLTGNESFVSNFNILGISYNTNIVKTPITSFADLLSPQLSGGKIGLPEVQVASVFVDWYNFVVKSTSSTFLASLAKQSPTFYSSAVPMQQAVESGEIAVDAYTVPSIRADIAKGAPVKFVVPSPAWAAPFYSFGVAWAKHPAAARVFLDFMMSATGQKALGVDGASALPSVTGTLTQLSNVSVSQVSSLTAAQVSSETKQINSTFGR